MKYRALVVVLLSALWLQVDAQSFLKELGKAVGNRVKAEVKKEVTNEVSRQIHRGADAIREQSSKSRQQRQNEQVANDNATYTNQADYAASPQYLVLDDNGKDVPHDRSLNYVDEYGVNHGGGVRIAGVVWAPVNCGYHKELFPYGKLYQWGRRYGQGYSVPFEDDSAAYSDSNFEVEIMPAPVAIEDGRKRENEGRFYAESEFAPYNWTETDITLWNLSQQAGQYAKNEENDPCPKGWRVPDYSELMMLISNRSGWSKDSNGRYGYWFSGDKQYGEPKTPRIFLPAAGKRGANGFAAGRECWGHYWSSRHFGAECEVGNLSFSPQAVELVQRGWPQTGMAIRCVKE